MSAASPQDDVASAREATRGLVRKVLIGTVLGGVVFAGLGLYADLGALTENLVAFEWSAFGLALSLATGNYVLRYVRWQYYLRLIDVHVPHGESALVFLSGFVMSVTPGKLGEVFKSLLLFESRQISIARTAPVVFAERLTDLLALVLLTAIGSLSFEQGLPVAAGGAALVAFALLASSWRALGEFMLRVCERLPFLRRLTPRLREAYESLRTMTRPAPLLFATGLATTSWALECVALFVLLAALPGGGLGLEASFFAYSASTIAGALAMMPGGLGVTEAGMTGLIETLSAGAVGSASATAGTMLTRLATLWWAVLVGAAALAILRARRRASESEG